MKLNFEVEENQRNVHTIRMNNIKAGWEQWFLLSADHHWDNPKCKRDLLTRHLNEAKERKAGVFVFGDLFCAMQGKYDKRSSKSDIRPEHMHGNYLDRLVETATDFYGKYSDNLIVIAPGNHETAILSRHETNITERLVQGINQKYKTNIPVHLGGYSGWVRFMFDYSKRQDSRNLMYHHGYGGDSPVTKGTIQTQRMGVIYPDADFVVSGHCFSEDTEILTPAGWKKYTDLKLNDPVATMNKQTKKMEFNHINAIHIYDDYKKLYNIKNSSIDILVTDKHGLCFEKRTTKKYAECDAVDFLSHKNINLYNGCEYDDHNSADIEPLIARLLVWIVADGSIENNSIRFHLRKERKIERLSLLLNDLGISFELKPQNHGTTKIRISTADSKHFIKLLGGKKELPDFFFKFGKKLSQEVIEEYRNNDGMYKKTPHGCSQLYSNSQKNLDVLQALCVKAGYKTSIYSREGCSNLNIVTKSNKTYFNKGKYDIVDYNGKVWCVNVDNGTLVVRRNGKVAVTLNTHNEFIFPISRLRISKRGATYHDEQVHIKVPTYKEEFSDGYGGWHIERGGPPKPIGGMWLKFSVKNGEIVSEFIRAK